jgi:hypothetical protein
MKQKIQKQGEQIRRLQAKLSRRQEGEQASGLEGSVLLSSLFLVLWLSVHILYTLEFFFFFVCIFFHVNVIS